MGAFLYQKFLVIQLNNSNKQIHNAIWETWNNGKSQFRSP